VLKEWAARRAGRVQLSVAAARARVRAGGRLVWHLLLLAGHLRHPAPPQRRIRPRLPLLRPRLPRRARQGRPAAQRQQPQK